VRTNCSLSKNPKHIGALTSLGAIGVLTNDQNTMEKAARTLRSMKLDAKQNQHVRYVLAAISQYRGRGVDDVSRTNIVLNPSSAREWTNLSLGGDAASQLALKLAYRDFTMSTEDLSVSYEKSGSLGDVQSGILLSPWRVQGWEKLKRMI
jgi:superkiller protein 3